MHIKQSNQSFPSLSSKVVLSIIGPTAVGKSALALKLAEQLITHGHYQGVDLISVDSRQIYQGMEIVTGGDIPEGFIQTQSQQSSHPVFERGPVALHGLSLITPNQEWSVAHFQTWALPIIELAWSQQRLPILVGGTGLYHDKLWETDPHLHIPPNDELRTELMTWPLAALQQRLQATVPAVWETMNHSDQHNPRRLMRAIELATAQLQSAPTSHSQSVAVSPILVPDCQVKIGLTDALDTIQAKIKQRVVDRLNQGAVSEVERLIATYDDWRLPAFSATGVKELRLWLDGILSKDECLELWARREFQYAKRQLTWWKKQPGITWFEATNPELLVTKVMETFILESC